MRPFLILALLGLAAAGTATAQDAVGFNSEDFQLVNDPMEQRTLLTNTPQWVVQLLRWPREGEIQSHLGIRSDDQIAAATADLERILSDTFVPEDISTHWVPLVDWNIFYTDWIDHGGADAFLANWQVDGVRIQVIDSPNFVIVGARPSEGRSGRLTPEEWVVQVVESLCADGIQPIDPDNNRQFRTIEIYQPNAIVEGDWIPQRTGEEASNASPDTERIKFFTNSQIVALSVPKYLWDRDSLVNPFAERFPRPATQAEIAAISDMLFQPDNPPMPEPIAYDPTHMRELVQELLRTTPSEALLHDWSRRMVGTEANPQQMNRLFEDLTTEQKGLWHAQQLAERLMAEGVRSLAQERYDEAATRFMHVLLLEPENVSANMMLDITRDRAQEWALSRSGERGGRLSWFDAADQAMERHRLAVEERRIQMQERSERELQLRDYRTQWLEAYQEGDLRRARQILQRMLEIDPGNASARFFVGLIEHMMEVQEAELD